MNVIYKSVRNASIPSMGALLFTMLLRSALHIFKTMALTCAIRNFEKQEWK
jgi:hypothetical protein